MDDNAPRYASLRDYARLLRKQWPLILIPVVVAVGAALAYSLHETKTYDAQAQVLIQDETQQLTLLGTSVLPSGSSTSTPTIVAQTVGTPQLAAAVSRSLHQTLTPAQVLSSTALSVDQTSGLLDVDATARSAEQASALANAYAEHVAATTTASVRRQFGSAVRALRRRLGQLNPASSGNTGERATLQDEISRLEFLRATSTPGQVAKTAVAPGSPSSPKPVRDVGLGLLAGLLIGVIAAFLRESFDRRVRGSASIAGELGLDVLGHVRGKALGKAVDPSMAFDKRLAGDVEAFRILRNNVELLVGDQDHKTVLVTSALPEEGKSTVAASLALASAAAGRRTLLIEADLRRPSLAQRLGIPPTPGLADYLAGTAEPEDVLRSIPLAIGAHDANGHVNGTGHVNGGAHANGNGQGNGHASAPISGTRATNLVCLPAGRATGGSAEMLASGRMRELLSEVSSVYELVILDSAPLLPVADTLALLSSVGAVIVCVRSGRTTHEQTRAALAAVSRVDPRATGVVVTDVRARDEAAGHGMYPYYYSYTERTEA